MSAPVTEQQLALLLQAARDFAFQQLAQGQRLIPYAARAKADGAIDFIRFVGADSEQPLGDILDQTQSALAAEARAGQLLAAATVALVEGPESDLGAGFDTAIRVHVEAPGHSRIVLVPYRIEDAHLFDGEMVVMAADAAVFVG